MEEKVTVEKKVKLPSEDTKRMPEVSGLVGMVEQCEAKNIADGPLSKLSKQSGYWKALCAQGTKQTRAYSRAQTH